MSALSVLKLPPPPKVRGCCCCFEYVEWGRWRKAPFWEGKWVWERSGTSRWKSGWKRCASKSVLTRHSTLHVPNVVPFQAHRETVRSQATGHILSPVSTIRKNSPKMWCCLVLVPWFAAVVISADRLDLQTSILLILSITQSLHSKESLDFRQHHWHLLILSSVAFLCLPQSEALLQHSQAIFFPALLHVDTWREHSWVPGVFPWLSCKLTSDPGFWFSLVVYASCSLTQ